MNRLTVWKCPQLSSEALSGLNKAGIITVLDFIAADTTTLSQKTCLSKEDVFAVRKCLIMEHSAPVIAGDHLFDKMVDSLKVISTGCSNLDQLLGGGLYSRELTELYGPPAVGKTQSCLSIACHIATEYEKNTIYIDTGGAFECQRAEEIIRSKYCKDDNKMGYSNHLTRIQCIEAFDIFSAFSVLEELVINLSAEKDVFYQDVVLVVVDSVANLISPILGGAQNHGHIMMVSLGRMLKSLANDFNMAVLMTNNIVSDFTLISQTKPALGKTWLHIPNNRVHICHSARESAQRLMKMTKSCRMPLGDLTTTATITENGLT